jgi:glycosyltransferase involved in cell wall biosynthesis
LLVARNPTKRVAFVSSFLPRKCGIATFTSDLINNIALSAKDEFEPLVVAMRSENLNYNTPVRFEIRENVKNDYISAANYINFSNVDLVSVQHEFGLFGGEAGSYLGLLLSRLNAPVITTLHTVPGEPGEDYYRSLADVCNQSHKVITMNKRGETFLQEIYGIANHKIHLIPHGIPDLPFVDSYYYKHKFGMENRKTILTFGLISKNKGIEYMLEAMPAIVRVDPSVLYVVLGMTHPCVLKYDGESYRLHLQRMVKNLGLQKHVIFHNRFVNDEELHTFLCAADIYVTPYLSKDQLTSGTLSFAVGAGKAVVSTPYWAAMELLSEGRGKLVPFADSGKLAEAVTEILLNEPLFHSLRRQAYDYGRSRTWPKIGQVYWKLFKAKDLPARAAAKITASAAEPALNIELPEPSLDHMRRLTDDTGIFQHANFTVPDRKNGYSTDDNARALIATTKHHAQYSEQEALRLFDIYLSFVMYAQGSDGSVRNFMNFDRTWRTNESSSDSLGRILWALGTVMAKPPLPAHLSITKECFDNSVKNVEKLGLRGMAYSILGMSDYLKQFPGASDIKRYLTITADRLAGSYEKHCVPDWQWFEHKLTYDNAVLPHALFVAGLVLDNKRYTEIAKKSCEFLLTNTYNDEHFSFIGCKGWYKRDGTRASFDQQPIEAASTVMMLNAAYEATKDGKFLMLQRKAFDWFLGENDLHIPLYDFRTKGCYDGLGAGGVNINQGAESILSFLLGLMVIIENDAAIGKIEGRTDSLLMQSQLIKQKTIAAVPIRITTTAGGKRESAKKTV